MLSTNFFSPEFLFKKTLIIPVVSFFIQNTTITLLILALFGLVILHEPISHIFIKEEKTEYEKFETKHFWQTLFLIPIFSVPFLWVMYHFGIFKIVFSSTDISNMILQFIGMVFIHDAYFYFCHRLLHTKFFWKIHGVHHRAVNPTVTTSHLFHYIETFINYSFIVWFTLFIGILFGGIYYIPVVVFTLFTITWNIYGHGGKNLLPDSITKSSLGKLIVWPTYHHSHHQEGEGNYCFFLTYLDTFFKTKSRP